MTTILAELFIGESPCDDCPHVARCSAEKLACRPFFDWSSLRPMHGTQTPTREMYWMVFPGERPAAEKPKKPPRPSRFERVNQYAQRKFA